MLGRRYAPYCSSLPVYSRHSRPRPWLKVPQRRYLTILAIETSCDDTAVAILDVKENTKYPIQHAELLYNEKITSNNLAYGGIHPLVALESHRKHLSGLVQKALYCLPPARNDVLNSHELLLSNGLRVEKPNAVAVTRGPGMRSSLMAGLDTAKGLAVAWNVPLIGVHHMQAHALTPRLCAALEQYTSPKEQNVGLQPAFPFLTLLISGGHTLLLHSTGIANHSILANTDDIAIGDCLDKCARSILPQSLLDSSKDVSYGRLLESFAFPIPGPHAYDETALSRGRGVRAFQSPYGWQLPVPLLATRGGQKSKSMKFSYTGLVTFATRVAEKGWVDGRLCKQPRKVPMPEQEARYLAREVMRIAFEHLASRVSLQIERERVAHEITPTTPISNALVISGGVAANQYLRHVFQSQPSLAHLEIIIPPIDLCTDNAAMIAWAAHEMLPLLHPRMDKMPGRHQPWEPQQGQLEMDVLRKWSLENILHPETELDARDRIGDAATALGRDPSALGDTSLVNQESHQFERRCVVPRESVHALTLISSKMKGAISDSCGSSNESLLPSTEDVVKSQQQMQNEQSSRNTLG